MSIDILVALYRASGRPMFDEHRFSASVDFGSCIKYIDHIYEKNNVIQRLSVDGVLVHNRSQLPDSGEKIEYEVLVPAKDSSRFYLNVEDMLANAKSISKGAPPVEFYLVDEDLYNKENPEHKLVVGLDYICRLINCLVILSHYKDKNTSSRGERIVFVKHEQNRHDIPVVIETKVTPELLQSAADLDLSLIETLCNDTELNDPHYTAKIGVLNTTIAEFCGDNNEIESFRKLILKWADFRKLYHSNLEVYLSGFAFQKARMDVAHAELDLSESYSKVLSDISGKLMAIPVSIAGLIALFKVEGVVEQMIAVFALIGAALIISASVINQRRQFDQVKHARGMVADSMKGDKRLYPKDLSERIDEMDASLNKGEKSISLMLNVVRIMGWVPAVLGTILYVVINT